MLLISPACSTAGVNLLARDRINLDIVASATHEIKTPTILQQGEELVIYGKIKRKHGFCMGPLRVDVAILDASGNLMEAFSLPHADRGSHRPGWRGAAFRTRFPIKLPEGATVRLAIQAPACYPGDRFTAAENKALP